MGRGAGRAEDLQGCQGSQAWLGDWQQVNARSLGISDTTYFCGTESRGAGKRWLPKGRSGRVAESQSTSQEYLMGLPMKELPGAGWSVSPISVGIVAGNRV